MGAEAAIADVFAKLGGEPIDPPVVMPAAIPLDLSGESVRSRLCVFQNARGEELALRPDLTLAVARAEIEARQTEASGERVKRYAARAFRLPLADGDPIEFTQMGVERFGAPSSPEVDADLFAHVAEASKAGGAGEAVAWFGDLAVFPAFIDALDVGLQAGEALKRAFREPGGIRAVFEADAGRAPDGLAARLMGASWDEAEALVRDVLAVGGLALTGARGVDEIVERLLAQAGEDAAAGVPDGTRRALEALEAVDVEVAATAEALGAVAKEAGVSKALDGPIDALARRHDAIAAAGKGFFKEARFRAVFGRRFNYYDGFLFELSRPGGSLLTPFGSGGRYDSLLGRLSAGAVEASAIGGIVRPDRLREGGA